MVLMITITKKPGHWHTPPICMSTRMITGLMLLITLFQQRNKLQTTFSHSKDSLNSAPRISSSGLDSGSDVIRPYTQLIFILIEGYIPYTIFSLLFIGFSIAHHDSWNIFLLAVPQSGVCLNFLFLQV